MSYMPWMNFVPGVVLLAFVVALSIPFRLMHKEAVRTNPKNKRR